MGPDYLSSTFFWYTFKKSLKINKKLVGYRDFIKPLVNYNKNKKHF